MKLFFKTVSIIFVLGLFSCGGDADEGHLPADLVRNPATASGQKTDERVPKMVFENPQQDFGSIVQGTSVTHIYKFTNKGDADLIISFAKGSCGCTIPSWPKRPIKPGQSGEIEVIFNSAGKKDAQNKKVYITANTSPSNNIIALKGTVVAPENK